MTLDTILTVLAAGVLDSTIRGAVIGGLVGAGVGLLFGLIRKLSGGSGSKNGGSDNDAK